MTRDEALTVDSIHEESEYIDQQRCACGGGFLRMSQALHRGTDQIPYDCIRVQCRQCGQPSEFWFNCSRFYGKSRWRPASPP